MRRLVGRRVDAASADAFAASLLRPQELTVDALVAGDAEEPGQVVGRVAGADNYSLRDGAAVAVRLRGGYH